MGLTFDERSGHTGNHWGDDVVAPEHYKPLGDFYLSRYARRAIQKMQPGIDPWAWVERDVERRFGEWLRDQERNPDLKDFEISG